ncbi:MAG: pseudaminic acid synthase [Verrucomicrobiota bacterium]|nr:pseudaminic acid synthase [Verrucomicrobiota bacterium]
METRDINSPIVIAEISGNHGGSLNKAITLVEESAKAGADFVKLQTYKPETITVRGTGSRFKISKGLWKGNSLHELYAKAMTPWQWHKKLSLHAKTVGIPLFSSPFDESAVRFLESEIDPPFYKIASFELNHYPMLQEIAKTSKPVFASIGVSDDETIKNALEILDREGCPSITLLHCVSEYPAKADEFFLREMPRIKQKFNVEYGLSDHSPGHVVAVAATALGAKVIEKHITLDRSTDSIDGKFSMLPHEFKTMVDAVKLTSEAMGIEGQKKQISSDASFFKRSILVSREVRPGEELTSENLRIARPGDGMCPSFWSEVLNKKANKSLSVGHPLSHKDLM